MSQSGELVFYSVHENASAAQQLGTVLNLSGASQAILVSRRRGECRDWEDFKEFLAGSDFEAPRPAEDLMGQDCPISLIPTFYRPNRYLWIWVGSCAMGAQVHRAINAGIPENVRGSFAPGELYLGVGFHDLYESAESEEGMLIARAFFSISFWGYSTPNDWTAFRNAVFSLPEIKSVKASLESVLGPLEQCAYWDI